jgi:hypothetical protein
MRIMLILLFNFVLHVHKEKAYINLVNDLRKTLFLIMCEVFSFG